MNSEQRFKVFITRTRSRASRRKNPSLFRERMAATRVIICRGDRSNAGFAHRTLTVRGREYEPLSPNVIALHLARGQRLLPITAPPWCHPVPASAVPQRYQRAKRSNRAADSIPRDFTHVSYVTFISRDSEKFRTRHTSVRCRNARAGSLVLSRVREIFEIGLRVLVN